MPEIKVYEAGMQQAVEVFFEKCFFDLGWDYEPDGEHSDIVSITDAYMKNGCMWCMFLENQLIGTIAVRVLDHQGAEMKRLYVLKEFQGNGYGNVLFQTAIDYIKNRQIKRVYADTASDRDASQHILRKYGFIKTRKYPGSSQYTEAFYELTTENSV